MKNLFVLTLVILTIALATSCNKNKNEDPQPDILYNISGSVNLYDEGVTQVDSDGMTVSIVDANPAKTSTTDVEGKFSLEEVEKGTYDLVFEKSGYGTYKVFGVDHNMDEPTFLTNTPSLGQKSTTSIKAIQIFSAIDEVTISATLDQDASIGNPRYIRVLFSSESNISPENYDAFSGVLQREINPAEIAYSKQDLLDLGFTSGQTVYVNVAGDSFWSNEYEDPQLERTVFPNILWKETAVSFVVP